MLLKLLALFDGYEYNLANILNQEKHQIGSISFCTSLYNKCFPLKKTISCKSYNKLTCVHPSYIFADIEDQTPSVLKISLFPAYSLQALQEQAHLPHWIASIGNQILEQSIKSRKQDWRIYMYFKVRLNWEFSPWCVPLSCIYIWQLQDGGMVEFMLWRTHGKPLLC